MASLKDIFIRGVQDLIEEGRTRETPREKFEGAAEMANPSVIQQPVRNSATSTGEPLNFVQYISKNQTPILIVFGGLLMIGVAIVAINALRR